MEKHQKKASMPLVDKVCDFCGKVFCRSNYNDYAYKTIEKGKIKYYCSYSCKRKGDKEIQP